MNESAMSQNTFRLTRIIDGETLYTQLSANLFNANIDNLNKDLQDAKRLIKELVECCEDFELRNKHLMGCGATVQYGGGCNCMDREYYSMRSCEDRARSCLAKNQDAIKKFREGV